MPATRRINDHQAIIAGCQSVLGSAIERQDIPTVNALRDRLPLQDFKEALSGLEIREDLASRILQDRLWPHEERYLEECRRSVPRYLFRGIHPYSGGAIPGLNGPSGVIPHAFLKESQRSSIYEYSRKELQTLIEGHLGGDRVPSPFSSWSPSLRVAISFTYGPHSSIAILDLAKLPKVAAYPLSELYAAELASINWPREFLVFGRVEGENFSIMPFNTQSTLNPLSPVYITNPRAPTSWTGSNCRVSDSVADDLRVCVSIARPLGPSFVLPFSLALLVAITHDAYDGFCGLPRDLRRTYRINIDEHFVGQIIEALAGLDIPFDYSLDPNIVITDRAWTGDMYDVKQWLQLLKAIAQRHWVRITRQRQLGWPGVNTRAR